MYLYRRSEYHSALTMTIMLTCDLLLSLLLPIFGIKYAKQKHLGCKKVWGQSEATLQTGRHDQKQEVTLSKYF